jgi:NAD(P)-dependent dehydrogenase (short-subunit alcohol dehydrogenase family)
LYDASCRCPRLEALQALKEDGIKVAALDVTSTDSIAACMAEIAATAGAVHILINNAGKYPFASSSSLPKV